MEINNDFDKILVLDFGGQYSHLITRRFRNLGFYSEIALPSIDIKNTKHIKGIVLSGGPSSVYDKKAPHFNKNILKLNIPVLGLCYGHQLLIKENDGKVNKSKKGEYGFTILNKIKDSLIFDQINFPTQVWMSHSDAVIKLPKGFETIGSTENCKYAAIQNLNKNYFGLQFHAEVADTLDGNMFLINFASGICKMKKNWNEDKLMILIKNKILLESKNKNILMFLSGGVDSSVAFYLLQETLGKDRVLGLYINNGFMRHNESKYIKKRYKKAGFKNIHFVNKETEFLNSIKGFIDPQEKRKAIGEIFVLIRDQIIKKFNLNEDEWLLAQGTLYPDIIESGGSKYADTIKTHHNRVEGIKQLIEKGLVIEPLKDLYKDEVRNLGKILNMPDEIIYRHPFPGPGISVNLLCSNGKISSKNEFNDINKIIKKIKIPDLNSEYNIYILPVKSVGVQGDFRTYTYPIAIKINNFFENFKGWEYYEKISSNITNEITQLNRVVIELFKKKECNLIEAYCTKERLDMIRKVDHIVLNELKKYKLYNKIFQHLTINLPYASNNKSCSIVLRPVSSEDVMTARFAQLDICFLKKLINKIKKLKFVDALYYDITNKPPATFGWE